MCYHTHKSARVVVADGFSVSEGLEQRVGLQDDVFDVLRGDRFSELMLHHKQMRQQVEKPHTSHPDSLKVSTKIAAWRTHAHLQTDTQNLEGIILAMSHVCVRNT